MPATASKTQNPDRKLRFDVYEADPRFGELRKHGVRIPLEDRPFRALLILLRRANDVVTREELQKQLWPSDVFIDFDHGLNTVIRKIRLVLNDRAEAPRFIETLGRRGYRFIAPAEQDPEMAAEPTAMQIRETGPVVVPDAQGAAEEAVAAEPALVEIPKSHFARRSRILATAAAAMVLLLAYLFRPAMPMLRVSRIVQLTKSGGASAGAPLNTDGPRVYYQSKGETPEDWQLKQLVLNNNEDAPAGIPAGRFRTHGLSPDGTQFLATPFGGEQRTVWTIPVAGGSPRRVGNLVADEITWSHDGNWFAYAEGNQLFVARTDGTSSRPLAAMPEASATIYHVRWSPDDRHIRFTLQSPGPGGTPLTPATEALWEIDEDGRNLHQLRFDWPGADKECCGEWSTDGSYFVFKSNREGVSNLWALGERSDWWRRANHEPVQLTSGPMNYYQPIFSRDDKSIFAIGAQPSGELVHYDGGRKEFVPFLSGRSIDRLAFTRDGQWVAYVDYPEGTLWRARSDGSEQLQLTFPPMQVGSPRWSPDGKRIAFHAKQPGQLWKSFVISAEGGNAEPFPSEALSQTSPDWMPGRDALIYSRAYGAEDRGLYLCDLRSGRNEKIPGTDGLYGPIWSPDGRHLSVVDPSTDFLFLFDLQAGKRTQIAGVARWPSWSADSQYIYFRRDESNWIWRVRVPDGREEKAIEVPFRLTTGAFTLAPDSSPILLREHGRYDVYSLSLSVP